MFPISGTVCWYVIGRFYTDANGDSFDAGYLPYLSGFPEPFFAGAENEKQAYFTFCADKFTGTAFQNGNVSAVLFPPGNWTMYLLPTPVGNWRDPLSFKGTEEQQIARWRRATTTMSTSIGTNALSLLTFELVESWDFEWKGKLYNLRDCYPNKVTQLGFGSAELLDGLPNYPSIKAFTASAFGDSE